MCLQLTQDNYRYTLLSLVHNIDADADADADAGIEMNPIPASASTSKDAACVKAVSLMLTFS